MAGRLTPEQQAALRSFKHTTVQGLYLYSHWERPDGHWLQIRPGLSTRIVYFDGESMTDFSSLAAVADHLISEARSK